ncbi:MAG: serine hydrolase [Dehalococcoidia bacterium]|nr:serine hydrolase [Dehalococcoidia bacterium]
MVNKFVYIVIPLLLLSSLVSCTASDTSTQAKPDYWPTEQWRTAKPEAQGMDSATLEKIPEFIKDNGIQIDSVLVVRHGYLVYEHYPNAVYDKDMVHIIHSVTKSVVSSCIGIAIREGYIKGIDAKFVDLFPDRTIQNLDDRKNSITLENVLTMKVGLEWDEWKYLYSDPRNHFIKMLRAPDPIQYVLDIPMMEDPGVRWNYNGGTSHVLSYLLGKTTGQDSLAFARKYLFEPMGIKDVDWTKDSHGVYNGGGGMYLKPRDMAKIGFLYLHDGVWDKKQLVPADFAKEAVSTKSTLGANSGYGYQSWWTWPLEESYYAAGLYGQRIFVAPKLDLVAVITTSLTSDPEANRWVNEILRNYVLAACE